MPKANAVFERTATGKAGVGLGWIPALSPEKVREAAQLSLEEARADSAAVQWGGSDLLQGEITLIQFPLQRQYFTAYLTHVLNTTFSF